MLCQAPLKCPAMVFVLGSNDPGGNSVVGQTPFAEDEGDRYGGSRKHMAMAGLVHSHAGCARMTGNAELLL